MYIYILNKYIIKIYFFCQAIGLWQLILLLVFNFTVTLKPPCWFKVV